MSPDRAPIRSYQRIWRPERRIYQVEGHRLPVPGGVPLRWLGCAIGSLLAIVALSGRSPALSLLLGAGAAGVGLALGGRSSAAVAGIGACGAAQVLGYLLATIDWPMRLVILPALVATLATQATPDGRHAHRFAWTWLAQQLRPERRTLGRPLTTDDAPPGVDGRAHVAPDAHGPVLRRGRVHGPAVVRFAEPLHVADSRLGGRRRRCGQPGPCRGSAPVERVELGAGERLEVRP